MVCQSTQVGRDARKMKSFWFKPRQIIVMDAQGGRPARNFYVRTFTLVTFLLLLAFVPFGLGAYYAPFHSIQEIIPENLKLKRKNAEMKRELADANTLNALKDEQINSLKDQLSIQERNTLDLSKQLHMFNSILDERKGKGIQVLKNQASWIADKAIEWQALFVKGGSYPRYLKGSYEVFAQTEDGHRMALTDSKVKYNFESHAFFKQKFEWDEDWKVKQLELIVYNSRNKEVLKQTIQMQGN